MSLHSLVQCGNLCPLFLGSVSILFIKYALFYVFCCFFALPLGFSLITLNSLSFVLFCGRFPQPCLPVPWLVFLMVLWFFFSVCENESLFSDLIFIASCSYLVNCGSFLNSDNFWGSCFPAPWIDFSFRYLCFCFLVRLASLLLPYERHF